MMTLTRRKRAEGRPEYGTLMDVFQHPERVAEEGGEEEEYEVVDTVEGGSLGAATFGLVKGTVGPAILFLPRGFKLAGWAIAVPALLFSTATYLYSATRLLDCWKIEKRKQERLDEIKALLLDDQQKNPSDSTGDYGSMEIDAGCVDPHCPSADGTMLTYPEIAKRTLGPFSVIVSVGSKFLLISKLRARVEAIHHIPADVSREFRRSTQNRTMLAHVLSSLHLFLNAQLPHCSSAFV